MSASPESNCVHSQVKPCATTIEIASLRRVLILNAPGKKCRRCGEVMNFGTIDAKIGTAQKYATDKNGEHSPAAAVVQFGSQTDPSTVPGLILDYNLPFVFPEDEAGSIH